MKKIKNIKSLKFHFIFKKLLLQIFTCLVFIFTGNNFIYAEQDSIPSDITLPTGNQTSEYIPDVKEVPLPVELEAFSANVERNNVILNWTTAGELNNSGFDVERKLSVSEDWAMIGNVYGNGTVDKYMYYTYEDKNLQTGRYKYRLKQIDFNGNFEYFDLSDEVAVGIPTKYNLSQNYPNPFNPTTRIDYDLPYDGRVSIVLYDVLGREAARLVNEDKTAGYHNVDFNASYLSSGAYFYKITALLNGRTVFEDTKRMMLVK